MDQMITPVYQELCDKGRDKLAEMYSRCFRSTWETTLQRADGTVFLITGDIPAMWLRDSSAQVFHYIPHAVQIPEVGEAIEQLLKRQFMYITIDPYANAFNKEANGNKIDHDRTNWTAQQKEWIWERKYEIDSLCYPIRLAHAFWKKTGSSGWCDENFRKAAREIVSLWETEQDHCGRSEYFFERIGNCPPSDTLINEGKGAPVRPVGLTWSGFRPSDDACKYGYLIPANFFARRSLEQLQELISVLAPDAQLLRRIQTLHDEIDEGLRAHAVVRHEVYGDVYAYEVDGLGNYNLMDDANVPSLLSLPYLGCLSAEDPVYQNTRKMLLSEANPYYYAGTAAKGIGSPHTPNGFVWPISLCIQGLTSQDAQEIVELANMLESIDAGTYLMHEGVNVNDPNDFTRPWFAWANSIFSEFMEKAVRYL
ncbi:MAG: glycoside hydrolase family 125 protein [Eubacteriales bacterium]|nr:glycoside hydrolase family 125 protein [Eubacteriales bacterium]